MLGIPHRRDGEGYRIEVNTMEENGPNIIENEKNNRLIHDTFVAMDENAPTCEIYEDIHDVPLIDKVQKPLYKDSKTSLLSALTL